MRFILAITFCLWTYIQSAAQSPTELVHTFFNAMSRIDSVAIKAMAASGAQICSSDSRKNGEPTIRCADFLTIPSSMAGYKPGDLDEQIRNVREDIRGNTASVSMEYDFFLKKQFSHCGVNVFHFLKEGTRWKISSIDDTRESAPCMGRFEEAADKLLDNWHAAAARADSNAYFNAMADDAVFIGTESSEVWSKDRFLSFAAPYFKRGKAWDFSKISRNLYYDGERELVWFDEVLDTWMGPCRGSGWIAINGNTLKIKQYVLSVTVPNDKIEGVLQAIGANRRKRG